MAAATKVAYATHDGSDLVGDLYLPDGAGPFPALIGVHGGGWQGGTRASYRHWGPWLARNGYGLLAIDYRLARKGEKMFPQSVQDVRAAVQYLRGMAPEHKVDPERIALVGDSAGAHLASLVGLAGAEPLFAQGYSRDRFAQVTPKVKAVVGVYGVYDMAAQWQHDLLARPRDPITETYLGTQPIANRRLFFDASPLSYVTVDRSETAFLLAYGTADEIADPETQSVAFLQALRKAGFFVRSVVLQAAPHFWMSDPLDEPGSYPGFLAPRLLRFLAERL